MDHWVIKKLPEICNIKTGKMDANHAKSDGRYRFYTCSKDYLMCETKSFSGPCVIVPGNGDIGLVFYYDGEFEAYQRTYVLCDIRVFPKYLFYHLLYQWRNRNSDKQFGSTVRYVRMANFTSYEVPIPSLPEQQRIVARIEELFSELDASINALKKMKAQLALYRQAVLKQALDGAYITKGSNEYRLMRIDDFADIDTGATPLTSNRAYYGGEIAWVASGKINEGKISSPTDYITELAIKETNCKVFPAGTLLVAMYGEGKTRGKCARLMIPAATNQALAAITLRNNSPVNSSFLEWFLIMNYQEIRRKAAGGVQPNLNLGIIKAITIKVFSKSAQEETVREIESKISVCDSIEQTIDVALQQAEAMRQSILKKAFEGHL